MADFGSIMSTLTSGGATTLKWMFIIIGGVLAVCLLIGIFIFWKWKKNKYNLSVEIKMPRSDGKIVLAEWGRGSFNAKKGVVFIKRNKMKEVAMKVIDIRRYL